MALANLYKIAGKGWGKEDSMLEEMFVCPQAEGYFQGSSSCKVYYQCVHGVGVRYECGMGLVWNNKSGICDWEHNIQCFLAQDL